MSRLKRNESIRHIMKTELQTITVVTSLAKVGKIFSESNFHHLPVVSGSRFMGILSFVDLMKVSFTDGFGVNKDQPVYEVFDRTLSVEDIMTKEQDAVTLSSNQTIREAAEVLAQGDFHSLPIVDEGELIGLVTSADLIHFLLNQY